MLRQIDARQLRNILGQFATGVVLVTFKAGETVRGITVNSFTSVSLDPPLVLVCIDNRKSSCELIHSAQHYVVNVLSEIQVEVSKRFAGQWEMSKGLPFSDLSWRPSATSGAPVIDGVLAYLDCKLHQCVRAGDHTIFIGQVWEMGLGDVAAAPLIFHRGKYTSLAKSEVCQ